MAGATLGKAKDKGSWQFDYNYRDLEADAVVGAFSDSDFAGGGTGAEGHKLQILLPAMGLACEPPQEIDGWWLDRLVYALNPKRNRRRSPVLIWRCDRPAVAQR